MDKNNQIPERQYIYSFNPDIVLLNKQYQDYLYSFDAGVENYSFNEFLLNESFNHIAQCDGVTHLVFDVVDTNTKKLVAYYTLAASSIPYIERWKIPIEAREPCDPEYDELYCGISAVEIKMFAVSKEYQDLFYVYESEEKPIAAWILQNIIGEIYQLSQNTLSVKAIFLRSVPDAEEFYKTNGFDYIMSNMNPFYSVDEEFHAMFLPFVDLKIHFDE